MRPIPSGPGCPLASVPDPALDVLDDDSFLVELISQLTRRGRSEVRERLIAEHRSLGESVRQALADWNLPVHEWSARLASFYEQTDAFLYETSVWNRCPSKFRMRRWIAEFLQARHPDGARVLCYGDGLGFDSLYLAQAGHQVTYFEVSERCRQFASAIFQRAGARVGTLDSSASLTPESFDAVVCLDVLGHVPDPSQVVRELARQLRWGGSFLVHSPFFYVAPAVGTHLRSNRRYSGDWRLYAAHHLRPVAGEFFWNPLALQKMPPSARPAIPPAIHLGGWLLSVARFWHAPHVFVCQRLLARADRRELTRRAESLAGLPLRDGLVDSSCFRG